MCCPEFKLHGRLCKVDRMLVIDAWCFTGGLRSQEDGHREPHKLPEVQEEQAQEVSDDELDEEITGVQGHAEARME